MPARVTMGSLVSALLAFGAPSTAAAQGANPALSCAQAAALIREPASATDYYWAINTLPDCTSDWPLALASLWDSPPRDTSALGQLVARSGNMRDQRVFDAALRVTQNAGITVEARLAAMQVLAMHYHECLVVMFRVYSELPPGSRVRAWLGEIDHGGARAGRVALRASVRGDVLSALDALATPGTDPVVQQAARSLATALRRKDVTNLSCDGNFIRTP